VREGDFVQKGQFLLQIDPTIYEANMQRATAAMSSAEAGSVQARANRDQAQRGLQRTKELHEQNPNLVSQEQLEQAQTAFDIADANLTAAQHNVEQSRAGLREARDQLAKTHLVAPMSGRVTRLAVEEGEVAVPGTFSTTLHFVCNIRSPSRRHLVSSTQLPDLDYVAHPEVVEHRDTMLNEQAERNCANNANTKMGFFTFLNSWTASGMYGERRSPR